jgi:ferredoxin-NADP reductase
MKRFIESCINTITMYRLVLYSLVFIAAIALILSAVGVLKLPFVGLIISLMTLVITSYAASKVFAWIFSAKYNRESWTITALILFFLLLPIRNGKDLLAAVIVAVIAVASKYILAYRQRHIFNPAAIAVVVSGLVGAAHPGWWIATPYLLPVVGITGLLIAWKVCHFAMVATYIGVATITALAVALINNYPFAGELSLLYLSSPIVFAACIMLTEPLTSPSTRKWRLIYAALVGFLTTSQFIPFMTPELAIIIGNIFVFIVGQKGALAFEFIEAKTIAPRTLEIVMRPVRRFTFKPGQYLELSLPHSQEDARGARRTFSIASSPHDEYVRLGLTISDPGSSFKKALVNLKKGAVVHAARVGGDFTLPASLNEPLLLIAGGIGVTPFRSMLDDLVRRNEIRDIVLIYGARSEESLVYEDIFTEARAKLNLLYIPIISEASSSWGGEAGVITFEMISHHVKDLSKRKIYISGPSLMVEGLQSQLTRGGIQRNRIVKDYFSGY